ncbi:MAG: hypothetical protein RIB79_01870 [Allomuricauda sp.]|jgi:hypothetical protein
MKTQKTILSAILFAIFISESLAQVPLDNIFNSIVGPNSEPIVYNTINMNSFDLISSNIQFSEKNNSQKLVVLPFKLFNDQPSGLIRNLKLNIAQKNGISTFGIGIGLDNSSPFSKRGDDIFNKVDIVSKRGQSEDESDLEYQQYEASYALYLDKEVAKYYENLLKNSFQLTFGFNISYFSIIGGDKVDLDENGLIDNEKSIESFNYSLGASYTLNSSAGISASLHIVDKLGSAEEGQERVPYLGGSFTFAKRILVLDSNYKTSKDYFKSLFVPSIIFGFTFEYQEAQKNFDFAKDGIIRQSVYTPFLDFKINPKNQFRLGIPIQKLTSQNRDLQSLGPFIQWGFSIANKGK